MNARINGPWKENGADGPIDWTDFDEETVECVLSYFYVQDYSVPSSEPEQLSVYQSSEVTKGRPSMAVQVIAELANSVYSEN